jgi:murein DD-endopeptidase MepM/ murein hydrolase activator NlpD
VRVILAVAIALGAAATPIAAPRVVWLPPSGGRADVKVAVTARALQPGELAILTLTTATPVDSVRVRAFDRDLNPLRTGPTEWRVLIGIDLETKPGPHAVSIAVGPSGTDRFTHTLTILPKKFATRELKVDAAFVNPPPEAMARIKDDTARLNRVWASSSATRLWSGPFVRPVADPANSVFGTRSVYNGEPRSPHGGADFLSPAGTPVKAPNAGRVVFAGDLYFTGNTIVIDHGAGLFSLFAHLRAISVHESDTVTAGTVIGEVGATGRVTGPHLHWAIRANGARVDPMSLLAVLGESQGRPF